MCSYGSADALLGDMKLGTYVSSVPSFKDTWHIGAGRQEGFVGVKMFVAVVMVSVEHNRNVNGIGDKQAIFYTKIFLAIFEYKSSSNTFW